MPSHKNSHFGIYAVAYVIVVILSGALIGIGEISLLGDSFDLTSLVWVSAWLLELDVFTSVPPRRSRDWIAHIASVSVAISGATAYLFLATRFSLLLNRNVQLICGISLILCQLGTLYWAVSSELRELVKDKFFKLRRSR